MNTLKIEISNNIKTFFIPNSFNELKPEMFKYVLQFILSKKNDILKPVFFLALLGYFDTTSKNKKRKLYKLTDTLVYNNMMISFSDIFNIFDKKHDFTKWIIEIVNIKNQLFLGPSDFFNDMTFAEFIAADMFSSAYFSNKSDVLLNKLIAVLYLPQNKKNRADFNSETLNERAEVLANLSDSTKSAIFFNYIGIRNWITKEYPLIFSSSDTSTMTNIQLGRKENTWLEVRRHLAGNVLDLDKIDNLNLHEVLAQLEYVINKNK